MLNIRTCTLYRGVGVVNKKGFKPLSNCVVIFHLFFIRLMGGGITYGGGKGESWVSSWQGQEIWTALLLQIVYTTSGLHPNSYSVGIGGCFSRFKAVRA
jgi:hypothetical protein